MANGTFEIRKADFAAVQLWVFENKIISHTQFIDNGENYIVRISFKIDPFEMGIKIGILLSKISGL